MYMTKKYYKRGVIMYKQISEKLNMELKKESIKDEIISYIFKELDKIPRNVLSNLQCLSVNPNISDEDNYKRSWLIIFCDFKTERDYRIIIKLTPSDTLQSYCYEVKDNDVWEVIN